MSDKHEDWLWQVGNHEEQPIPGAISDDLLMRYRRGELPEDESSALDRRLSVDANARRRLTDLARVEIPAPRRVRERLFGVAPQTRAATIRQWGWLRVAAAAAGVLLVPLCVWRLSSVPFDTTHTSAIDTASLPRYSVSTHALAEVRSSASSTRAFPDTVIELELLPDDSRAVDTEVALYRKGAAQIERIADSLIIATQRRGNAARIRIRAGDLVGDEPGVHSFYVVIAQPGALPPALHDRGLETDPGDSPSGSAWHSYQQTLEIIRP